MSIIDAGATKLVGLQIDTLTKYRAGQLSFEHWERFLNLSPEAREERFGDWKRPVAEPRVVRTATPTEPVVKFDLLVDFGVLVVPGDHIPETYLTTFKARHQGGEKKSFAGYNDDANDANFPNPTWVLQLGQRLWVRAHKQVVSGYTTSQERMAFLATLGSHHTGAQGLALVFDHKRDQLPKGFWYASMDEKERLWEDAARHHRVPGVDADGYGRFHWRLGRFEDLWYQGSAFLSFCDPPLAA